MLVLHLIRVLYPVGDLILAGAVATLIIERLICVYEKNKSSSPLTPQKPDFTNDET
jgi:hypothetical protein